MKKVLFVLHIPPPIHGAAMVGKYITESSAINSNFDTTYLNLSTSSSLNEIGKQGIKKLIKLFKIQLKLIKLLLRKDFDLVYMTLTVAGAGFYKDLFVVLILKSFRKKIVYHFHNKGVATAGRSKTNSFLYKFVFQNSKVILLAPVLFADIKAFVNPQDVLYCANGIPDSNLPTIPANKSSEKVKILFLSNMMAAKGVYVLLEACALLAGRGLAFECHFAGAWSDVSESDFKNKIIQLGLENCVFAHGPQYGADKMHLLKEAQIFAFPTFYHNECLPLVLLEAMQYYLPVVSTPEGAIDSVVDDEVTGYLIPQENSKELANKLAVLINNPAMLKKMGMEGRKRFEKLFTLPTFEYNFVNTLKDLLTSFEHI